MRQSFFAFILVLLSVSCQDDNTLSKVCPQPQPCYVRKDGSVITEIENIELIGTCRLGYTTCNEDKETICVDYVVPEAELCDGLDNDCDGEVDEDYDKDKDKYTTCGSWFGIPDCDDENSLINPSMPEVCNNKDDDCDGVIDERVTKKCWNGGNLVVDEEPSICKSGTSSCTLGKWNSCKGEVTPTDELCDGLDNDCDGDIDEKVSMSCGLSDVGTCSYGDLICSGNEQLCVHAVYPTSEICNNADDDCDGQVDENVIRECNSACGTGIETCQNGNWVDCSAAQPTPELCDGVDNDCDGVTDEDCPCILGDTRTCTGNIFDSNGNLVNCGIGAQICNDAGQWGTCYLLTTTPEMCNDWDDDCDGVVDQIKQPCGNQSTAGIGECRAGTSTCTAGVWGICAGAVSPQVEICDRLDNDCDGQVDENLNPHNKVDMVFAIDISGSMCSSIQALVQGINNYINGFAGTDHRFGIVTFPGLPAGSSEPATVRTSPALVDAFSFRQTLSGILCNGGGQEPSYDVMYDLADQRDPLQIGWRRDAQPYIIMITDERPQSWNNIIESNVAPRMRYCRIGSCSANGRIEVYVISQGSYYPSWDDIVFRDLNRYIDIYPADAARYTTFFRNVFQNVCI